MRMMYKIVGLMLAAALFIGLTGCGGGDGGDGDDGVDARLVGTWQFFESREDGNVIPPAEAMGWDEPDVVRTTVQFSSDGTVRVRDYNDDNVLVSSENGTWTASSGTLRVTIAGDEPMEFDYTINGNLLELRFTEDGHQMLMRWVKDVNLAGHDAALVRTWLVHSVRVNGEAKRPLEYFDLPPEVARLALQLLPDGTLNIWPLSEENEILNHIQASWATGGGSIAITTSEGKVLRGAYVLNNTSITVLDEEGCTVEIQLQAFAPPGQRSAQVLGSWQATSVTVDGASVPLADFFEWPTGGVKSVVSFFADGTMLEVVYDAGDEPVKGHLMTWNTVGNTLNVQGEEPMSFTYSIAGGVATLSASKDGRSIVLTFTRV